MKGGVVEENKDVRTHSADVMRNIRKGGDCSIKDRKRKQSFDRLRQTKEIGRRREDRGDDGKHWRQKFTCREKFQ